MNISTFGKDRGCQVFCMILNEQNKIQKRRACMLIEDYLSEIRELQKVENYRIKIKWLERIYLFYKNKLLSDKILNTKVKDFGNNVLITWKRNKLREWIKRSNNSIRRERRQKLGKKS